MRTAFLFLLSLLSHTDYEDFIHLFSEARYNAKDYYPTRSLNWNDYSDLSDRYSVVPDERSFVFLCDEDSSKLFYEYDLYHMEEGYLIEHVKEEYDHYAIASFRRNNHDMVIYSKYGPDNERYYLRSFDKKGSKVDELMVNEIVYEGTSIVAKKFRFSLINDNSVKIFSYRDSTLYDKDSESNQLVAKVLIEDYTIDSLGRFNLANTDSVFLSKSIQDYRNFNTQPNVDDPIAKYWTQ